MSVKKIKKALTRKRKLTYKELEWDYMPMIVLFGVVAGVLTLLLILLAVYQDTLAHEEITKLRRFRLFDNYLNSTKNVEPTITVFELEEEDGGLEIEGETEMGVPEKF